MHCQGYLDNYEALCLSRGLYTDTRITTFISFSELFLTFAESLFGIIIFCGIRRPGGPPKE